MGKSGNDLHYRGYDILDLAKHCEYEEIAHLLIHGHLPNHSELNAYKAKLKSLRGLPIRVIEVLESLPAHTHPMDVMRTGVSMLGCVHLSVKVSLHQKPKTSPINSLLLLAPCSYIGINTAITVSVSVWRAKKTPSAGISCTYCTASVHQTATSKPCTSA